MRENTDTTLGTLYRLLDKSLKESGRERKGETAREREEQGEREREGPPPQDEYIRSNNIVVVPTSIHTHIVPTSTQYHAFYRRNCHVLFVWICHMYWVPSPVSYDRNTQTHTHTHVVVVVVPTSASLSLCDCTLRFVNHGLVAQIDRLPQLHGLPLPQDGTLSCCLCRH